MEENNKWAELLVSLKKTLGQICALNMSSKVTIINFSSVVKIDYVDAAPNSINVEALTFQRGGTNFERAFASGLDHIVKISKHDIVLVFMTDGEAGYPAIAVENIKNYLATPTFQQSKIKFSFNAIGFKCHSNILNDLVKALGGTTHFADSGAQLTKAFMEILNKTDDEN